MLIFHRAVFAVILISLLWPTSSVMGGLASFPWFKAPIRFSAVHAADHEVSERETRYNWVFQRGDWLSINLTSNTLRIVRSDGREESAAFDIGSGIRGMVNWLGMTYDATTPAGEWMIQSKHQQGSWWVFGSKEAKEQLFLRLYRKNDAGEYEYTHYGIHTTPNIDPILDNNRYASYGCILAQYDVLKLIEELYEYQGGFGEGVRVVTSWE